MDKDKVLEYMLANEKARYDADKEFCRTIKSIAITIIICVTISVCFYMYFVVPTEEVKVDNDSKAVINSSIDKGSNIWQ